MKAGSGLQGWMGLAKSFGGPLCRRVALGKSVSLSEPQCPRRCMGWASQSRPGAQTPWGLTSFVSLAYCCV